MCRSLPALLLLPLFATAVRADGPALDLTRAVVVTPGKLSGPEEKAVAMLLDEVEKRTQIRWQRVTSRPAHATGVVVVGTTAALAGDPLLASAPKDDRRPEGYRVWTGRDTVCFTSWWSST